MARKLKIMENKKHPLDNLKNDEITEKREKWEMHTVGPGIWRENWKSRKMINTHFRTWNIARKTDKCGKFWNVRCRTWNIARKLKIMENEKHPLEDLKNDEITEKPKKWEMYTVGTGIWRENWKSQKMRNTHLWREIRRGKMKKLDNLEMSTVAHEIWQETENHGKWETSTWPLEKWRNHWKRWNMRNAHCRTWNMARKLKITEYEKYTI